MKRSLSLLLAASAGLAVLSLAGCSSQNAAKDAGKGAAAAEARGAGPGAAPGTDAATRAFQDAARLGLAARDQTVSAYAPTDEAATDAGRRLFDGDVSRSGLALPGGAVVRTGYTPHYAPRRPIAFTGPGTRGPSGDLSAPPPPLPAGAADYPAVDRSAQRGVGPVLAAFEGYQKALYATLAPIISRAAWHAARRRGVPVAMTPTHVTVHHTEGPQTMTEAATERAVRAIQYYHMVGRGQVGKDDWDDIGYHFLIDGAGRIVQGRPAETLGAHARGANENNIGVALMGNFDEIKPTPAQVGSLMRLVTFLAIKYRQDPERPGFLEGHQHYDPTSCPGRNVMAILPALRARIEGEKSAMIARLDRQPKGAFLAVAAVQ
ncbi:MAG: N-acetylmuramoyl-L-alanine amidase [Elusimicrobia bacterium]|nr:N-acetylmuramoyl-L-alanine amidase [Elusimicrobiota bacterium]